jgi:hypothetical protein
MNPCYYAYAVGAISIVLTILIGLLQVRDLDFLFYMKQPIRFSFQGMAALCGSSM